MARRLRLQFEGALYHIINRGNYRRDVFETAGAARAFVAVLFEACARHAWLLHAFTVMRNHFHLALETPQANLVQGMHWLETTFATRFNRLRSENGHLFQGRYKSPLIEDAAALVRVIDYIHLNPVRAGIVSAPDLSSYPWGSLKYFGQASKPACLTAKVLLDHLGLTDSPAGWSRYLSHLVDRSAHPKSREDDEGLSRGWAIGTAGWRHALAVKHAQMALAVGIPRDELRDIKEASWRALLEKTLPELGKCAADITRDRKGVAWKIAVARRLRHEVGAPHRWIAEALNMGSPASVRVYLCRTADTCAPIEASEFGT